MGTTNSALSFPEWTKEDYRTSSPFEWLYERRNNKFLLMQLIDVIAAKAGAYGVKNFRTLWKAYLEMRNSQEHIQEKNLIHLPHAPAYVPPLECGEYVVSEHGIQSVDKFGFPVDVCSHPILPIRRIINVDSGEVKTEIAFTRKGRWTRCIFGKDILASRAKIIELAKAGIDVDSEKAPYLVKYLSAIEAINYDTIPEDHAVCRLGWIEGYGFSPYSDNLAFDGDAQYRDIYTSVSTRGSYEAWLDLAKKTRLGNSIARICLAASFASVLVEPCGALPFFVHLWGGSGAGKSVSLMQAASVWADPEIGRYISTHDSTAVSQERNAGFRNSLPLCLDELQVVKDARSHDITIYKLSEGAGRGRGTKAGGIERTLTWRNCILSNGEFPILTGESGAGAVNRVLEIDCRDQLLFTDGHGAAEILRGNYGWAGKRFVEGLTDEVLEYARTTENAFFDQLLKSNTSEKQARLASMILTGDAISDELIFNDGRTLTMDDIIPYLASQAAIDLNARAYDWIMDFVATNPSRFSANQYGDYSGECWGEIDQPNKQIYIIKSVFDRKMTEAGYNPVAFLSWANRTHRIETERNGVVTKVKRLKGSKSNARCICVNIIETYTEADRFTEEDELANEAETTEVEQPKGLPF